MTRIEFKAALESRLSAMPAAERIKTLDYYDEIICDRTEEGVSESEAVAALGDIDKIAEEILCTMPIASLVRAKVSERRAENPSRKNTAVWIVLAILGSPVWFPLLIALIIIIFSVYIIIWSLIFSIFAIVIALLLSGIAGVAFAVKAVFSASVGVAFAMIGISLFSAGLAILGIPLLAFCFRRTVYATKAFGNFLKRQFIK